ncbi:hypothetical protein BCR43DRAFT_488419 [Syncephalastrum racemosum]|uniref:Invertebrate defensins family profile domain-containing protein n=1 Tax=Syncephalastrum racemosum TaxID=13706 RepID=A0A1X2HIJ6_SYNRA|nr:hypothetical protein BCR43DRAFT_488419 [Syncephalastrum racemosum]
MYLTKALIASVLLVAACSTAYGNDDFQSKRTNLEPRRLAKRACYECTGALADCDNRCYSDNNGHTVLPNCINGRCWCGFMPGM